LNLSYFKVVQVFFYDFFTGSFLRGRVGSMQHTLSGLLVKKK